MLAGEALGVGHGHDAFARIMAHDPRREGDRYHDRLHHPRRDVDDEPGAFASPDPHQLVRDRVDMPVVLVGRPRLEDLEALLDEGHEVRAQIARSRA